MSIDDRLKLLMDYTKFHIGIYISLSAVSISTIRLSEQSNFDADLIFLKASLFFLLVAGACGGIIASNIADAKNYPTYLYKRFGLISIRAHIKIEHVAFWSGMLCIVVGLLKPFYYCSDLRKGAYVAFGVVIVCLVQHFFKGKS